MKPVLLGLALLAIGFGSGAAVALTALSQARTRTVHSTTTTFQVVNGSRTAGRTPAPIPTVLDGSTDPHSVVLSSAIPADANLDSADYVEQKPRQLVVTWEREHLTRDGQAAIWQRRGIAIWELARPNDAGSWHRVYTYETLVNNQVGVEGFGVGLGDMSGDGRPEILVFFATDGSAGGGTYHLFANSGYRVREPLVKDLALDQGTITFAHRALRVLEGVDYRGPGIHCCYRKVRETWLRWDGRRLDTVRQIVQKNRRGWPPG
jgi:hypothetical protein